MRRYRHGRRHRRCRSPPVAAIAAVTTEVPGAAPAASYRPAVATVAVGPLPADPVAPVAPTMPYVPPGADAALTADRQTTTYTAAVTAIAAD